MSQYIRLKIAIRFFIVPLFTILFFSSCNSTKYVPDGKYLLNKNEIKAEKTRKIKKDELNNYIKQKPNKKILGTRFHLGVYNLANIEKDKGWSRWFKKIGEEPVIYDPFAKDKTISQLSTYFANKGYFRVSIDDTVMFQKKKANVEYRIETKKPYRYRKFTYSFEDTTLTRFILKDTINTLLKKGAIYDIDQLQKERERIEVLLRNKGFYKFNKEFIRIVADSSLGNFRVDLEFRFRKFVEMSGEERVVTSHKRYKIDDVYIFPSYNPKAALLKPDDYFNSLDTMRYEGINILTDSLGLKINPKIVVHSNYIQPGELYELSRVKETSTHLSSLRLFRTINVNFAENQSEKGDSLGFYPLDALIQLTPSTLQAYTVEVEGTNSSGNYGFGFNLLYQHRNFLSRAEELNVKFTGSWEALRNKDKDIKNTLQFGVESNLVLPRFLLPFKSDSFIKRFNPKTTISLAYNYQRRPEYYTRTIANFSFGYLWKGNRYLTHVVHPLEFNFIDLRDTTTTFMDEIKGTYLENSYKDVLIEAINYSLIFNNQRINRKQDFIYFRWNNEAAGNILTGFNQLFNRKEENGSYTLLNIPYAQYAKIDGDLRYYDYLNDNNLVVYRLFLGLGIPYGNSNALPFEKKYFGGGTNDIRAWKARSLGPGSYKEEKNASFYNQTADIKIEANLEYRFALFWKLEGAMFLDAGNIWAINKFDEREGVLFEWNKFYKDIALGTGAGIRLDFSFLLLRVDLGIKLRDPAQRGKDRWIIGSNKFTVRNDMALHIGIGYPF